VTSLLLFYTLGRYIPEGFEKKLKKKLTNRYDTQSTQSNAGKQTDVQYDSVEALQRHRENMN